MRQTHPVQRAPGEPPSEFCADPLRRGCRRRLADDPEWEDLHWTICDQCSDALEVAWGRTPKTVEERLRLSGVPRRYVHFRWEDAAVPPGGVIGKLRGWRGVPSTVYLHGAVGVGKSGAVVSLLREWVDQHRPGRYLDARDWLEILRYAPDRDESRVDVFEAAAIFPGLLVLDELLTEKTTPESYAAVEITRLVDRRIRDERPTVIVGNHPLEAPPGTRLSLVQTYGRRLASRLADGLVLEWRGPDRRGRTDWEAEMSNQSPLQPKSQTSGSAWVSGREPGMEG